MTSRPTGLPDDWRQPSRELIAKAWDEHPELDRLRELQRERDANGDRTWETFKETDPDDPDWTIVWFRPVDPSDHRPQIRVTEWHRVQDQDKVADLQAIIDEHFLT